MKKLMIAAAIVCAAAFTQASTVNWSVEYGIQTGGNFETGADEVLASAGWAVYAFDAATVSQSAITALFAQQDSVKAFNDYIATQTYVGQGAIAEGGSLGIYDTDMTGGETVNGFIVLVAADEVAAGTKIFVSDTYSATDISPLASSLKLDDTGADAWGIVNATSTTTGTWGTLQAVPEPTSGLLLLIGVAGLALRRRRA